ncbi:MAG TPA: DUF445 family protein, partial [Limnochordia bacterium]
RPSMRGWAAVLLAPLAGALIGWLTNRIAIRMLFRPRRPWGWQGTPFVLQGLLPRRRAAIARAIAAAVEEHLLPIERLIEQSDLPGLRAELMALIRRHAGERLAAGWPRLLPPPLREAMIEYLRAWIDAESDRLLEELSERLPGLLKERLRIGALVEAELGRLDLDAFERLVVTVAGRELRHIEILGGVLGFVIGLCQAALSVWMG